MLAFGFVTKGSDDDVNGLQGRGRLFGQSLRQAQALHLGRMQGVTVCIADGERDGEGHPEKQGHAGHNQTLAAA
ncbi:hypothetical protein Acid7E03_21950 [Acidisoma sp. 7E03]